MSHSKHPTPQELVHGFPSELVSHAHNPWKRFHPGNSLTQDRPISYTGMGLYEPKSSSERTLDEHDQGLRAVADIALRMELNAPELVSAGEVHQSRLRIENEGQEPVSKIEVRDDLSDLHTVIAAEPDGLMEIGTDPETGLNRHVLHREFANLDPGDVHAMSLKWIPVGPSRQIQRARVVAHAEVSAATIVVAPEPSDVTGFDPVQQMPSIPPEQVKPHPALACDIQHLDRVAVGKSVELEITVRNTGNIKLHGVKVQIDVANQLSHRDGRAVVFDAGNLPVNGQNRTVLRLSAVEAGEAVNLVQADAEEAVEAKGRMIIHVSGPHKEKTPVPRTDTPQPRRDTARSTSKTPEPSTPSKPLSEGACCCQKVIAPRWISD